MAMDLNLLRIFERVVSTGSFTAAAKDLRMSKGAVSRHISALEEELGVRLLNRTTRRLSLTPTGQEVLLGAERMLEVAGDVEAIASQTAGTVSGLLRVSGPITFAINELSPFLSEFMTRYPDVKLDFDLTDHSIDFVDGGYDVGVRIGQLKDSSLIVRQLAPIQRYVVAAPSYLEKYGEPQTPEDLREHNCLRYSLDPHFDRWRFIGADQQEHVIPVSGSLSATTSEALIAPLLEGHGIANWPDFILYPYVASGQLVQLLPEYEAAPKLTLQVIYGARRHLPGKVRAFIDFMVEKLGDGRAPWLGVFK